MMHPLLLKNLVLSMAVGTALAGTAAPNSTPNAITATNIYAIQNAPVIRELSPDIRFPDALDRWLNRLIMKESEGNPDIRILDDNGEYSYGCLQFQMSTFKGFGQAFNLVPADATDEDLLKIIYNCALQKQIARQMILSNYENWQHWFNSVTQTSVGYPPRVKHEIVSNVQ